MILSLGMGLGFVPLASTALVGVAHSETGIASALVNTSQQIGGSLGTALLNGVATSTALHYAVGRAGSSRADSEAAVHGYMAAFLVGAVVLLCAAVTSLVLITARPGDLPAVSSDHAWR